jgi:2'-5' RNA ligase
MAEDGRPWRCFVAVPIPDDLRRALAEYVARLRQVDGADARWRWTDADGWHVTLAFLGSTRPDAVPALRNALASVATDARAFSLTSGSLGSFPRPARARVLWYGISDGEERLAQLARSVQAAVGLEPEPRFRAHLTLARARDRVGTDATRMMAGDPPPPGRIDVDQLVLFRSHLGRGPARYEALASAPLGARAA